MGKPRENISMKNGKRKKPGQKKVKNSNENMSGKVRGTGPGRTEIRLGKQKGTLYRREKEGS